MYCLKRLHTWWRPQLSQDSAAKLFVTFELFLSLWLKINTCVFLSEELLKFYQPKMKILH